MEVTMYMRSLHLLCQVSVFSALPMMAVGQDLHFKKSISMNGNTLSPSETWVSGKRERTVTASPTVDIVKLHQCDLKRTVTLADNAQSYFIAKDPEDETAIKA